MDRKVVIIPTYNEKENIEAIVRKVFSLDGEYNVLIIDDGSPDGTATIVKSLQPEFPERLFLIERSGKLGLGTAYLTGFKWALEKGYDYIFEMDADFSHNPEDLPRLLQGLRGMRRRRHRLPLLRRHQCRELAYRQDSDVLLRVQVREDGTRDEDTRLHGGF